MGNSVKPHREESWTIKTTKTTKRKIVHSNRRPADMSGHSTDRAIGVDQNAVHVLTIEAPTRVSSLDNIRTMSTVIAAEKLRRTLKCLEKGICPKVEDLQRQLSSIAVILDSLSTSDEERFLLSRSDSLSEIISDTGETVPKEVQKWLTATFTTQYQIAQSTGRKEIRFKHVISAVKCSLYVEKLYKEVCGTRIPDHVETLLKTVDNWTCDIFEIDNASGEHALRFIGFEIFNKHEIGEKFHISSHKLDHFLHVVQTGYGKHKNAYHNHCHAAEVLQTIHYFLSKMEASTAYTDIEIFAFLFGALIHDYEHTGKTNLFHVKASFTLAKAIIRGSNIVTTTMAPMGETFSRSELAMLYNDRSVQENHHISASFALLSRQEINILNNLSATEYSEMRSLVIDMVLGTDMSLHFEQLKTVKASLVNPDNSSFDPAKCMPFILHCADIGHPAKEWSVHKKWADRVMDEFFQQGDAEKILGLPFSPLCDRNTTVIPESQVGFITLILAPTLDMCSDVLERLKAIGEEKLKEPKEKKSTRESIKRALGMPDNVDKNRNQNRIWSKHLQENRKRWQDLCNTTDKTQVQST